MASIRLLGIFEDAAQRDFLLGLVMSHGHDCGVDVEIDAKLTCGCRFDYLADYLDHSSRYSGVVIAVDGKKLGESRKIAVLKEGLATLGSDLSTPVLWSVASPSIEEWMMADVEAAPQALMQELGLSRLRTASRPGRTQAERTAKKKLREWIEALTGGRVLQGGREYAKAIGRHVDANRIGSARNPDLKTLLEKKLPEFLRHCREPQS